MCEALLIVLLCLDCRGAPKHPSNLLLLLADSIIESIWPRFVYQLIWIWDWTHGPKAAMIRSHQAKNIKERPE
jgi:hypothetical protein